MPFSERSRFEDGPNEVTRAVEAARAENRDLFDLTVTNPTKVELGYPVVGLVDALSNEAAMVYEPESLGFASAREAIAADWARRGRTVSADHVLLTASTSEAYGHVLQVLCDPGDEVLVPRPSYPLLEQLARHSGVRLVHYPLRYDGSWHVDTDALRRARTERTRAVVVVSPNNPTGSFLKRGELERIAGLGLPIISDEVFADYGLRADRDRVESALDATDRLVFAFGGLSKCVGMPHLKLAWTTLGGPEREVGEALRRLEIVADTYLSVGSIVQVALPRLLELGTRVRESIEHRVRSNLLLLHRTLGDGSPASVLRFEGGWTAVLRLPQTRDDTQWTLDLLERGVVVQPGWFYDFPDGAYVVLSLLPEEGVFRKAVERIAETVAT